MKPKFTVCVITKNEEKTLPKLLKSLEDFKARGGETVVVDTGSNDKTVEIAKAFGCKTEEVGTKFIKTIDAKKADEINNLFIVEGEEPVVVDGNKFFDFSEARNYCTSLASNDIVSYADADEIFTMLDIDTINKHIADGWDQFEYNFVYAHDEYGNEAIKFVQSKMYNQTNIKWVNMVHEVLSGPGKRFFFGEEIFKLEHFQIPSEHRGNYLAGLALDCFQNQGEDRNSHYFARELMWCNRPKSAIKEFERHIAMNKWPTEKAQSMIFMGDCYKMLGMHKEQIECYNKSLFIEDSRREPFIKIAEYYKYMNNPKMVAAYTVAAMELPWFPFYANNMAHYTYQPHELLYWARGWLGDIEGAKKHILEALRYQPRNKTYLRDIHYYVDKETVDLPIVSIIIPQLGRPEGLKRLLDSIEKLDYPQYKIQRIIIEGDETVPVKVAKGLRQATSNLIVYAANDMEFLPDSLKIAVDDSKVKGLVAFDTGVRNAEGYICEHFLIKRDLIDQIGGEIFDTDFHHVGVDDLLWARCTKLNQSMISKGKVLHHHFSREGQEALRDAIIDKGWKNQAEDKELLIQKLAAEKVK